MQDTVRYVSRISEAVSALKAEIENFKTDDSIVETDIPEAIISGKISIQPTKNEIIFLMALLAFSESACSICLIECDHNGADPTKMLAPPFSSVICGTIPGEHTKETYRIRSYLEKGISEVISAPQNGETYKIISAACARINCRLSVPTRSQLEVTRLSLGGSEFSYRGEKYTLGLCGRFQIHNATTVIEAVRMLERAGFKTDGAAIKRALASVSVRSKFETLSVYPTIIADSTHKSEAVDTMSDTLVDFKAQTGDKLCLCISPDRELIAEYAKSLCSHGYEVKEIIVATDKEDFDTSEIDTEIEITVIPSFKAVAKRVVSAARESGFSLITGDVKTADAVRKEVLRILEF
jgi:dihydrofolate synthase/folylpolyglutamate synthase